MRALSRWLGGGPWDESLEAWPPQALLRTLQAEGVVGLAGARSVESPSAVPVKLRARICEAARHEALSSMLLEAETGRVLAALRETGSPGLLLKGSALAHWAYSLPHLRACSDVDILLPSREAAERLSGTLGRMGYVRAQTSGDLVAYELMCTREVTPGWAVEVDVHWRLVNSALFAERFTFEELMNASVPIPALGAHAHGLGPVDALLHAAMHRSSNITAGIGDRLKWLYDFVVLTQRFTPAEWRHCVEKAAAKELAGVTLSALEASRDAYGCAGPPWALEALSQAAQNEALDATRLADWRYMQAQTLRSLPGLAARMSWLWQRLFPSRDYMRYLYGEPSNGYAGLLRVRAQRAWRRWRGQA